MILALQRALAQFLADPGLRRPLWLGAGTTLLLLLALPAATVWLLGRIELAGWVWLDAALDWLGGLAILALLILLFPAVTALVAGLFLDDVAGRVEAAHYPSLGPPRPQSLGATIADALGFFAVLALANLFAVGLVLLVPGLNLLVFWLVNGWLLGREQFTLVAARRLPPRAVAALRRRWRLRIWGAGLALVPLLAIPIVNLAVPILAVATMVHLVQTWLRGSGINVDRLE